MTTEEQVENFLNFHNQLEKITQGTSGEAKKRIHYKTLRNFIYYYNSSKKGKTRTTELLKEYLKLLEEEDYMFTEQQSKDAYDIYIRPLVHDFYTRYVNFSASFAIVFELLLCGIPVYFLHSKITILLLLSLYFVHYINYFIKYRNKKFYGIVIKVFK